MTKEEQAARKEEAQSHAATVQYHMDSIVWCDACAAQVGLQVVEAERRYAEAQAAFKRLQAPPPLETARDIPQFTALQAEHSAYVAAQALVNRTQDDIAIWEENAQLARDAAGRVHVGLQEARANLAAFEAV